MNGRCLCCIGLVLVLAVSFVPTRPASAASCEFMMPVLTVNEKMGGSYNRLPFSFVRAGVPCLNALRLFEAADGKSMGEANAGDLLHDVLEPYWAAALDAKALLMSYSKRPNLPFHPSATPADRSMTERRCHCP